MSELENVRTVSEAYAAFQNSDIEGVLQILTDDIEWITPGPPELMPVAGNRHGREEVAQFFSTLAQQEEVELFEVQEYLAERDKVVALVKYRGRVRATGKTVESDLVHLFTFDRGKVKRFREFFDTASVLDAYKMPKVAKARSSR